MIIDYATSTVTIGGQRFPCAAAICPLHESRPTEAEQARAIATGERTPMPHTGLRPGRDLYIPTENGLIFHVEEYDSEPEPWLALAVDARACYEHTDFADGETMWLPQSVAMLDGTLFAYTGLASRGVKTCSWTRAEPEWVAETIIRLSQKPFTQPVGPKVRLVSISYFDVALR